MPKKMTSQAEESQTHLVQEMLVVIYRQGTIMNTSEAGEAGEGHLLGTQENEGKHERNLLF